MSAPPPFPWAEAMRVGLGLLRLAPAAFWGMTPRELAAAGMSGTAGGRPGRGDLAALMARYPDLPGAERDEPVSGAEADGK